MAFDQLGLVVPDVKMTQGSRAEDDEDVLCLGRKVRRSRRTGALGGPLGPDGRFVLREQALFGQEDGESDAAQACAAETEEIAAIHEPAAGVCVVGRSDTAHRAQSNGSEAKTKRVL